MGLKGIRKDGHHKPHRFLFAARHPDDHRKALPDPGLPEKQGVDDVKLVLPVRGQGDEPCIFRNVSLIEILPERSSLI